MTRISLPPSSLCNVLSLIEESRAIRLCVRQGHITVFTFHINGQASSTATPSLSLLCLAHRCEAELAHHGSFTLSIKIKLSLGTYLLQTTMTGHIDCYLDCSSFYSFLALVYLLKQRELLTTHDVSIELHPIFLGGINVGSGNKPPWTVPAKAAYGNDFESKRAQKYLGVPDIQIPPHIPLMTLTTQRALCYIKATFPQSTFERAWLALFEAMWIPPHMNPALPDALRGALLDTKLFSEAEVVEILAATTQQEWKDRLLANTKKALDQGAFGAPWMWVRNAQGKEEPFFGSDRFHHMWEYLGLPWKDVELLPKAKL